MTPKELIAILKTLPEEPIRIMREHPEYIESEANYWLSEVEVSETGESGYELSGEIRLIGAE